MVVVPSDRDKNKQTQNNLLFTHIITTTQLKMYTLISYT